jgi:hypothetical protein
MTHSDRKARTRIDAEVPPEWLTHEAAAQIRDGSLPEEVPHTIFAEPGRRQHCALCTNVVEFGDLLYRVEVGESLQFHVSCFKAWQEASRNAERAPGWAAGVSVA